MAQASGAMHVARVVGRYTAKSGEHREYVSHLLRRTFRADGKVRHESLGLGEHRGDVAVALIVARVCRPGSKLATTRWWTDTTLAADLGLTEVSGQGGAVSYTHL